MKKSVKILFSLFLIIICSACVKEETVMTINKDKSFDITVNFGYAINSDKKITLEEVRTKFQELNYNIDSYHDSKYQGYSISKKYDNLNSYSTSEKVDVNLADIIDAKFDDSKLFTIKKGFFKNTYTANFKYDFRNIYDYKMKIYLFGGDANSESINMYNYINTLITNGKYEIEKIDILNSSENYSKLKEILASKGMEFQSLPVIIFNDTIYVGGSDATKEKLKTDLSSEIKDYKDIVNPSNISNDYDLSFKLNIPYNVVSNNATNKKGNTYIWNADYFSDNNINFSFTIFKPSSIVIIIILLIIAIVAIVFLIITYKKMENNRKKFIMKNTDISNITPETNDEVNQIVSVNDLMKK